MVRRLYSLLLVALTPLIVLRLFWRSRRQPAYRAHLGERWGWYPTPANKQAAAPLIWVHAVSVGETRAAQPLIEGLLARWPGHRILLTAMTPTGRETGAALYGERVIQAYLPYDTPGAVARFFRHFSPHFGVLMETEIWPNLLAIARTRQIPVLLVNARLSARSAAGYGKVAALARPAVAALAGVAAQTTDDAGRLQALGARAVEVCGNLKFDVLPAAPLLALGRTWRAAVGERPVFLAASTREGEEVLILDAWRTAGASNALLVIVPRHPQRFDEVARLLGERGLRFARRGAALPAVHDAVWLGDSMGEMAAYYALADLAFIGGSLLPLGGQNLIEAAACGCPVLIGPHTFNFRQATDDACRAGAARRVADARELVAAATSLLADAMGRGAMAAAARVFATAHQGSGGRTLDFIARRLGRVAN